MGELDRDSYVLALHRLGRFATRPASDPEAITPWRCVAGAERQVVYRPIQLHSVD